MKKCEICKHNVESISACMICGYYPMSKCIEKNYKYFEKKDIV